MKKIKYKVIGVLVVSIGFIIGTLISNNIYGSDTSILVNSYNTKKLNISDIALMLETGEDTGEYSPSTSIDWPDSSEYTFNSTASKCENGSSLTWDSVNNELIVTGNVTDKCYIYFDVIESVKLADYIISLYTTDGENNLYYFNGSGDYTNASYEAEDYSYRYSGTTGTTYNYVCFGGDDCSDTENLYRIVGVFKNSTGEYEVKLVKYDFCTSSECGENGDYSTTSTPTSGYYKGAQSTIYLYYWNNANSTTTYDETSGYYNIWSYSELNTVNLNSYYLEYIGDQYSSMISTHTWVVGGNTVENLRGTNALETYNTEVLNPTGEIENTYDAKVGLLYVSDYYYASTPTYWSYYGWTSSGASYDYRSATGSDWLYMGANEWTITRNDSGTTNIMYINYTGSVVGSSYSTGYVIRPTFYLLSSIKYVSGSGTQSDPIMIST